LDGSHPGPEDPQLNELEHKPTIPEQDIFYYTDCL